MPQSAQSAINTVNGVATFGGFESVFSNVTGVAIAFAGIVLLVMLLIGGFNLITSGSEAPKAEAAKKTITYAIMGFVFVALAYLVISLIATFTGTPGVGNFTVVQP